MKRIIRGMFLTATLSVVYWMGWLRGYFRAKALIEHDDRKMY